MLNSAVGGGGDDGEPDEEPEPEEHAVRHAEDAKEADVDEEAGGWKQRALVVKLMAAGEWIGQTCRHRSCRDSPRGRPKSEES